VQSVAGGGTRSLGRPPRDPEKDWLALVRPADPDRNYPPAVNAGPDQTVMLPRTGQTVELPLAAEVTDDGKPGAAVTSRWTRSSGPGTVRFKDATAPATVVSLAGPGTYVVTLTASDGALEASDAVTVVVEPFSATVTKTFQPVADAYLEGNSVHDDRHLKVEAGRRISYLKFTIEGLPPRVVAATLTLTENGDNGGGTLRVKRGAHSDWTPATLRASTAPSAAGEDVGVHTGSVGKGAAITIAVTPLITGNGTYTVILTMDKGGNDIWFGSSESGAKPVLTVTAEDPEAR
jgi:hypothetical protein